METRADLVNQRITLSFDQPEEIRSFVETARAQGGFMLDLDRRPEPFASITLELECGQGVSVACAATVVQIFDQSAGGLSVALQLTGWSQSTTDELERRLGQTSGGPREDGEAHGASPIHRIRAMDVPQRIMLASRASRGERQILCRESSPQVLLQLLANPRLEAGDVLQIAKSVHANGAILQRIASERRWSGNTEIVAAVVRNPKTPTPLAIKLVELVPTSELREMAKMGALREPVRRAAFRTYQKRLGKR